ncbi:hypothetical protein P9H08_07600 [Bacillus cereus]|nr:hypothetical protein [Bacillus cereus]
MDRRFRLTEEEELEFQEFLKSDQFAEALAISWRYGCKRASYFSIRNTRKDVPIRFCELIVGSNSVSHFTREKEGKSDFWHTLINLRHPFYKIILEMGWTPIQEKNRVFPKGEFNEKVFVSTYIKLSHDLMTLTEKRKNRSYIRPRLRIHGSEDVLSNINRVLHQELGIGMKKLQTDHKIPQAKVISFQSKKEIPCILEFAGAMETLDKFHNLRLGYMDNLKTGEKMES